MAQDSAIEWCHHTFNPWTGCTKVSDGCKNCYAEGWSKRSGHVQWGPNGSRRRTSAANWKQPYKWNRLAREAGERHRVFCASLADVFEGEDTMPEEAWDTVESARRDLLHLIGATPNLDWLLLTKRPQNVMPTIHRCYENMVRWEGGGPVGYEWVSDWLDLRSPANFWIGTSVENQEQADIRIPQLLQIPAAVRFLSCEPLLGPLGLSRLLVADMRDEAGGVARLNHIHWVIVGGESGPGARPMNPEWARSIRDQCRVAGVPFHFKQHGDWCEQSAVGSTEWTGTSKGRGTINGPHAGEYESGHPFATDQDVGPCMVRVGKKKAGRVLDGRTWDEFPEVNR